MVNQQSHTMEHINKSLLSSLNSTTMSTLSDINTKALVTLLYVSVIVVAVTGNLVVCYIVLCFHRIKTVTCYFIVNLACSDMLMAIMCIPFTFVSNLILMYWPFGSMLCPLVSYIQVVSVFVSTYTMVAICIERYLAIVHPFRDRLTTRHALIMIVFSWCLSLTISLPTALTSMVVPVNNSSGQPHCYEVWTDNRLKYRYSLAIMALQYFIPVTFLAAAYGKVTVALWWRQLPFETIRRDDRSEKQKMVKIMMMLVVIYAVCWLPLHVITLLGDSDPELYDRPHMPILWICFHWLAMSNCGYNPFIYCWMSNKFKEGLRHVFRWCPCFYQAIRQNARQKQVVKRTTYPQQNRTKSNDYGNFSNRLPLTVL